MIDRRFQRKPKPTHPWVGWRPGIFSKADAEKRRPLPVCPRCGYFVCQCDKEQR